MEDTIASRIKTLSAEVGSLNRLGKLCEIGESTLRAWLGGTIPKADAIGKVADTVGVNLDWLVLGKGPMRHADAGEWQGAGMIDGYPEITPQLIMEAVEAVDTLLGEQGKVVPPGKIHLLVQAACEDYVDAKRANNAPDNIIDFRPLRRNIKLAV
ncbi:helix-turn-helix domain-containing protein [Magnetococcus sp. PR-3]|uniref:helix-turn-helix domain-containing protein n=1 Tax=Magnetococcus sp. PR-3 TaxID=3120355 RepID=UPI002FCE5638